MLVKLAEDTESRKDLDRISAAKDDLHHMFKDLRNYVAPLKLECQRCSVANVWLQAWANLESARAGRDASLIEQTSGVSFQLANESQWRKLTRFRAHDIGRTGTRSRLARRLQSL